MLVDDTHALMTRSELEVLLEYSCSVPSCTTIGKRWRRIEPYIDEKYALERGVPYKWWMGEYVPCDKPDHVCVKWREVLLLTERPPVDEEQERNRWS